MNFLQIYTTAGLVILISMSLLWAFSLWIKDASIVDIFWGTGFVVTAWVYFALTPDGFGVRKWLVVGLATVWGLRLSIHIFRRNHGKGEDFRYQAWRRQHGPRWGWRSFFQVFLLQGLLMWLISLPLLAAQVSPAPARLGLWDFLGMGLWAVGFFFEAAGDLQLARFKAEPSNRGKLLSTGVWRYTRHPNYFGDAAQWWAYFLFALAAGGWWAVLSPALMNFLLVRVSGVAMLEKSMKNNKPGYQEYIASTNAFIPWFPKEKV